MKLSFSSLNIENEPIMRLLMSVWFELERRVKPMFLEVILKHVEFIVWTEQSEFWVSKFVFWIIVSIDSKRLI